MKIQSFFKKLTNKKEDPLVSKIARQEKGKGPEITTYIKRRKGID